VLVTFTRIAAHRDSVFENRNDWATKKNRSDAQNLLGIKVQSCEIYCYNILYLIPLKYLQRERLNSCQSNYEIHGAVIGRLLPDLQFNKPRM